jgi:hypothetical protein
VGAIGSWLVFLNRGSGDLLTSLVTICLCITGPLATKRPLKQNPNFLN